MDRCKESATGIYPKYVVQQEVSLISPNRKYLKSYTANSAGISY